MIRAEHLTVKVGDFCLREISLQIEKGEYFVLLGPSGAGKSVLLETLMGLHKISKGRILLDGKDITHLLPERRGIAYVPQDLALFPHLNVKENILYGIRERKVDVTDGMKRLKELAEFLGIQDLLERSSPQTLSIGEMQRVAIARALIVEPKIIFLDEPFSSIDGYLKRQLQIKLREINSRYGVTIFHVTHDREEAYILGEKIGVLINGRIQQIGTRDDLYYRPKTLDVAKFMLNQNIFLGKVVEKDENDGEIIIDNGQMLIRAHNRDNISIGERVYFGIRPEEVMVIRPDRPLGDQVRHNILDGEVVQIFEKGGSHIVIFMSQDLNEPIELDVPNCAYRDMRIQIGSNIRVALKKSAIWILPEMGGMGGIQCF